MRKNLVFCALMACAALAVASYQAAAATLRDVGSAIYRMASETVSSALRLVGTVSALSRPVAVKLVQLKAYTLTLAKRQTPVLTASWRLCPSI